MEGGRDLKGFPHMGKREGRGPLNALTIIKGVQRENCPEELRHQTYSGWGEGSMGLGPYSLSEHRTKIWGVTEEITHSQPMGATGWDSLQPIKCPGSTTTPIFG